MVGDIVFNHTVVHFQLTQYVAKHDSDSEYFQLFQLFFVIFFVIELFSNFNNSLELHIKKCHFAYPP